MSRSTHGLAPAEGPGGAADEAPDAEGELQRLWWWRRVVVAWPPRAGGMDPWARYTALVTDLTWRGGL
jgi:hypothetical protein